MEPLFLRLFAILEQRSGGEGRGAEGLKGTLSGNSILGFDSK